MQCSKQFSLILVMRYFALTRLVWLVIAWVRRVFVSCEVVLLGREVREDGKDELPEDGGGEVALLSEEELLLPLPPPKKPPNAILCICSE